MALKRRDFEPNDRSVVCSCHFKAEDFDRTGQTTRIREGVIPSVFLFTRHLGKVSITYHRLCTYLKSLLEDLKHKHILSEELQQRLDDILLG
uniref:THAP-type domain-containing protein n=1 Tax=Oreochromis niloticus TaxID=8128 RepID=A0A669BH93_ORENI